MPVIINSDGLAENVAPNLANEGLQSGKYQLPLVSPEGKHFIAPLSSANDLVQQGYTQPNKAQLKDLLDYTKYSSGTEQVKTLAGSVMSNLTMGASRLFEDPEASRGRAKTNPGIEFAGAPIGLGIGMLAGTGEAALLGKAGSAAVGASGLGAVGSGIASKIAASALRHGVETALYEGGNEVSKLIRKDPEQSLQTALTHVGLAGAIGAVGGGLVGSVSPAWEAASGTKMGEFLTDFKDRVASRLGALSGDEVRAVGNEALSKGAKFADFTVDKAMGHGVAGVVGGMAAKSFGLPGKAGAIIAERFFGKSLESVLPALIKPIMEGTVNTAAFKGALEYGANILKGETLVNKAVQSIFTAGAGDIGERLTPTPKQKEVLESAVKQAQLDPTFLTKIAENLGHYLPDHAMSAGATVGNAIQFLNAMRPSTDPMHPLDATKQLSKVETAKYDRALTMAQQPLMAMQHLKNGNLLPEDVHLVKSVYPGLYNKLVSKITEEVITAKTDGKIIPYTTRMGLSLFLGQPLDSTLMPGAIASNQAHPQSNQSQQALGQLKKGTKALGKLPGLYAANSSEQEELRKI